jgi:hypothetical protein
LSRRKQEGSQETLLLSVDYTDSKKDNKGVPMKMIDPVRQFTQEEFIQEQP